jgi:hypothetical protein
MRETALAGRSPAPSPALVVDAVERAGIRFIEFFASAIRHLFKWLVIGRVISHNPAASVRGPSRCITYQSDAGLLTAASRQFQTKEAINAIMASGNLTSVPFITATGLVTQS